MSSTLKWEPIFVQRDRALGTDLKLLLRELHGFPVDVELKEDAVPQLRALQAGRHQTTKDDIDTLIKAIETHGGVRLTEGNW